MLHQVSGGSSIRQHYYPALQRQWGNISGPYILQTDMCTSFAKGVADFNAFMGREAIRLLFRGRGPKDPVVTEGRAGIQIPRGRRVSADSGLGVAFALAILLHCILLHCILHFDITSQLLEVGVPPSHPRRPLAGSVTTGQQSTSGPTSSRSSRRS